MRNVLRTGVGLLLDLLLPRRCASCRVAEPADNLPLCDSCAAEFLAGVAADFCKRCGSSLGPALGEREDGCPQCPTPVPRFTCAVRLGAYSGPLRNMTRGLKFAGRFGPQQYLADLLAQAIGVRQELANIDCIQPIPLHWLRQFRRGYNQAHLLARELGKQLDLPVMEALVRTRNTPAQVGLSRTRRLENIKGAFRARDVKVIADIHVLLVDDITTTGATANEAARTLLNAGAGKVSLAVLAKTDPPVPYTHVAPSPIS